MTKSKDAYKLLCHFAKKYGEITFRSETSPYGSDSDLIVNDDAEPDEKLEIWEILNSLNETIEELGFCSGGASEYSIVFEKDHLLANSKHEWNYNYLGSRWTDDLSQMIENKIVEILSRDLKISEEEFLSENGYMYHISYSTLNCNTHRIFSLFKSNTDEEYEISDLLKSELIEAIRELSEEYGANTSECNCKFEYDLQEDDFYIIEYWDYEWDLKNIL